MKYYTLFRNTLNQWCVYSSSERRADCIASRAYLLSRGFKEDETKICKALTAEFHQTEHFLAYIKDDGTEIEKSIMSENVFEQLTLAAAMLNDGGLKGFKAVELRNHSHQARCRFEMAAQKKTYGVTAAAAADLQVTAAKVRRFLAN